MTFTRSKPAPLSTVDQCSLCGSPYHKRAACPMRGGLLARWVFGLSLCVLIVMAVTK